MISKDELMSRLEAAPFTPCKRGRAYKLLDILPEADDGIVVRIRCNRDTETMVRLFHIADGVWMEQVFVEDAAPPACLEGSYILLRDEPVLIDERGFGFEYRDKPHRTWARDSDYWYAYMCLLAYRTATGREELVRKDLDDYDLSKKDAMRMYLEDQEGNQFLF